MLLVAQPNFYQASGARSKGSELTGTAGSVDMTDRAGPSSCFDGDTDEADTGGAQVAKNTSDNTDGVIYLQPASAVRVWSVDVYGSNDKGFIAGSNPSITITLRGKNGSAFTGPTDGTQLGSITFTDTSDESGGREILSSDVESTWDYIGIGLPAESGDKWVIVETDFFESV